MSSRNWVRAAALYDYLDGKTLVGFEDAGTNGVPDKDFDDMVLLVSNVWGKRDEGGGDVPEPETYTLLLTGLGMMGFMARRKKISKRPAETCMDRG